MTVGELLTAICTRDPEAEVIIADSPFLDGDRFTIDLVTEDDEGRVVLSPDVVLSLRERNLASATKKVLTPESVQSLINAWLDNAEFIADAREDVPWLLAELTTAEAERDSADRCQGCGGAYRYDVSIPSWSWNTVIRAAALPEYLCAACIIRAFVKAGQGFTAELSGDDFTGERIEVRVNSEPAHDAGLDSTGQP